MSQKTQSHGKIYAGPAVRILLWFAANPDEELTIADVAARWDLPHDHARHATRMLRSAGWLDGRRDAQGWQTGPQTILSASPALLKEIGRG